MERAVAALTGVRVVHLSAMGPIPFATMLLADLGADVIRVDRASAPTDLTGLPLHDDPRTRGQRAIGVDLKQSAGVELVRELVATADVFLEGMRPGAAERLGLGPADLRSSHDRLIYGRMTGWGQQGRLASHVGHDINYLAVAGALHPMGPAVAPPAIPLNLVADFGGGGTYLVMGVLAALVQRAQTGQGQVIDCAMVDGVASLTTLFHGMLANGTWTDERESNLIDGAAPFYSTYRTADGGFMAVGAMEPRFYAAMLTGLGLELADWPQNDRSRWAQQREQMAAVFAGQTRAHWTDLFAAREACVTPVLTLTEAAASPELQDRATFIDADGVRQPAPAPRLSDSTTTPGPRSGWCSHTDELLADLGHGSAAVADLRARSIVA
jgi:alpha-methylacyl-CoA racemase